MFVCVFLVHLCANITIIDHTHIDDSWWEKNTHSGMYDCLYLHNSCCDITLPLESEGAHRQQVWVSEPQSWHAHNT